MSPTRAAVPIESLDPVFAQRAVCHAELADGYAFLVVARFDTEAFAAEAYRRTASPDDDVQGVGGQAPMSPNPPLLDGTLSFSIQVGELHVSYGADAEFTDRELVRSIMATVAARAANEWG